MNLLIYAKPGDKGSEIKACLEDMRPDWNKNYFSNLEDLEISLKKPLISSNVVILMLVDQAEDLNRLLEFKETLSRFDSVLVLNDENENTRAKSYALASRLVLTADVPAGHILMALDKLTNRAEQRTAGNWG
jgi:hypothetical protein